MPPKKTKKKTSQVANPAQQETTAEDLEKEIERKALAEEAKRLFDLTKKEETSYNEYQQQRERINYFWIVEKKRLEDRTAELMNKERELQDLIEKNKVEIKVYKQRVKHLLHEHQNEITQLKTEAEAALKLSQDDHREVEAELKSDRRSLKLDLKELEIAHENFVRNLKTEHDKSITQLRQDYQRQNRDILLKYERRAKTVRDELESRRKSEIQRIEDRKNAHIVRLMRSHEQAFNEIKAYYNDITHNNLDLIKTLKEEVSEMKKKETQDEKRMYEIAQENKRMSEPLQRALNDVERLKKALEKYNADKEDLRTIKAKLLVLEDQYRNVQWEHEVLKQRYDLLISERDELHQRFQETVYDVQRRAGFKTLLLEKKLHGVSDNLEQKEIQLNEILSKANLDTPIMGQVKGRLEELVVVKNQAVHTLQQELRQIIAAHHDMVHAFDEKLKEKCIPREELGFEPVLRRPPEVAEPATH